MARSLLLTVAVVAAFCLLAVVVSAAHAERLSLRRQTLLTGEELAARQLARLRRQADVRGFTDIVESSGSGDDPLGGGISNMGLFYTDVQIGTPGAKFDVQIDTGSSDLGIPLSSCKCGDPSERYDPSRSSSSQTAACTQHGLQCPKCSATQQCSFQDKYADGSGFSALVYQDYVSLAGLQGKAYFGAFTSLSSGFEPANVAGIMGLAYPSITAFGEQPVFDALVNAGAVDDVFAICLNGTDGVLALGSQAAGGFHTVGGVQYTPIINETYYVVNMTGLAVGGKLLPVAPSVWNNNDAIADSGTTLFLLPDAGFKAFGDALTGMCSSVQLKGICGVATNKNLLHNGCFEMSQDDIAQFPQLTIHLGGNVQLPVAPQAYLYGNCSGNGDMTQYGLGIASSGGYGTIMGDIAMQNWLTIFDRQNKRLGFATLATGACQ